MAKTKILIVGLGGVGGYFGGLLANFYQDQDDVDVYFLARGNHLSQIKKNGLNIIHKEKTIIAHPTDAADNPSAFGVMHYILFCTKTYDLKKAAAQIKPCIDKNTVLLPLLNGVNNQAVLKEVYSNNLVLNGCVYIVSRLTSPGTIENKGNIQSLFFGGADSNHLKVKELENILIKAGLEATNSVDILKVIWEKYIFLSSIATATTYYDEKIGQILNNEDHLQTLTELIKEVTLLAKAKNIILPKNILEKTLTKLKSLPGNATSSMHTDFILKKPITELDALTKYVVQEGKKYGVKTKTYSNMLQRL